MLGQRRAQAVDNALADFAGAMVEDMARYPPARPWKSRPPKTGPRRGGRRTGKLGRRWRITHRGRGRVRVVNDVGYAVYVQGPRPGQPGRRQVAVMTRRGWQALNVEVNRIWPRYRKRIEVALGARFQTLR